MDELQVALRDLEDEYADGLITANAFYIRKEELNSLLNKEEK